jgi:hypothetical protein
MGFLGILPSGAQMMASGQNAEETPFFFMKRCRDYNLRW